MQMFALSCLSSHARLVSQYAHLLVTSVKAHECIARFINCALQDSSNAVSHESYFLPPGVYCRVWCNSRNPSLVYNPNVLSLEGTMCQSSIFVCCFVVYNSSTLTSQTRWDKLGQSFFFRFDFGQTCIFFRFDFSQTCKQ